MTAVTHYTGSGWDTSLPDRPKDPLVLPWAISHDWDFSRLTNPDGTAINSITGTIDGTVLSGSTGGTLKTVGQSRYLAMTGTGSLTTPNTLSAVRTVLVIARPKPGDTVAGVGPIFSISAGGFPAQGIGQGDADTCGLYTADGSPPSTKTALRGKWHVYEIVKPTSGDGVWGVDTDQSSYTPPVAGAMGNLGLAVAYGNKRGLDVTRILTINTALDAADLDTVYAAIKAYYYDLDWAV